MFPSYRGGFDFTIYFRRCFITGQLLHVHLSFRYRHQFYLHAKLELCEGRLRPTDSQTVCKTIGLLAQAEFGDCDDLVALAQFYAYWCEHLGVSVDNDDKSVVDWIRNLHSDMKVRTAR